MEVQSGRCGALAFSVPMLRLSIITPLSLRSTSKHHVLGYLDLHEIHIHEHLTLT